MSKTDTQPLTPGQQAILDAIPVASREGRLLPAPQAVGDDFELPAKACDLGRPEGCESCQ